MSHKVVLSIEARAQLDALYDYIAEAASAATALRFVNAILDQLETLRTFPKVGALHDPIRPGLRTIGFRRRVTIAFVVEPAEVLVVGIFYGGQDYATILTED